MTLQIMTATELAAKTAKGTITTIYGLPDSGKSTFMVTVAGKVVDTYGTIVRAPCDRDWET